MPWKKMLAHVSGEIDEDNLKIIDYLLEENQSLHRQIKNSGSRIILTNEERKVLAEKAVGMGRTYMDKYVTIVQPDTILKWFRGLVARKFNGAKKRRKCGRPSFSVEIESIVVSFAKDNPSWGYDKIMGAMENIGYIISDTTISRILNKHNVPSAPNRIKKTTWAQFIKQQRHVLLATDFFTTEIWTKFGLTTYYVLFFIHVKTRKITISGSTEHPNKAWVEQCARNLTDWNGDFKNMRYLIHDRDKNYTKAFDDIFMGAGIQPVKLPPSSPNLNSYAERFVRSIKDECLNRLILFGEKSLNYVLKEYIEHYHHERNHQGIANKIPFPDKRLNHAGKIVKHERLGGLLNYYHREVA